MWLATACMFLNLLYRPKYINSGLHFTNPLARNTSGEDVDGDGIYLQSYRDT